MSKTFFNAHHSPIGAFASFTLGFPGAKGGLGLELDGPANQNVYIGLQARDESYFEALPFFAAAEEDESKRYSVEQQGEQPQSTQLVRPFAQGQITREFDVAIDSWRAGDLSFSIYSPARLLPDPAIAGADEVKRAILPAVFAELSIDNREGTSLRRAFFGFQGSDPYSSMRRLDVATGGEIVGIGQGRILGIVGKGEGLRSAQHFGMEEILSRPPEQWGFGLGSCAALIMDVPAGECRTYQFALCFHRAGIVTANLDTSYYYTRFFPTLEAVASYALEHIDELIASCREDNRFLSQTKLSADQRFMLAHAIHSYYGSTQLLEQDGKPLWVVNEGEYRMMNTFDLTADQLFYELRFSPWTVRNVLDLYVERYSYEDRVHFPGEGMEYPGGISFTHDMGIGNTFSPAHYSSYEQPLIDGCFSYMTTEQLLNWICCATTYVALTGDQEWLQSRMATLIACFNSLLNRDDPEPERRNGLMGLDSIRAMGKGEITTYDSLDTSLGQARNNIYIASKTWAAYVQLERLFVEHGMQDPAQTAGLQAERCANTVADHLTSDGYIPAVFEDGNTSRIIPAIEGLIFPYVTGNREVLKADGRFGAYIRALATHLETVLQPGTCLFPDGGWKLSSTSDNSWLSKIYLCQYVARQIFQVPHDEHMAVADAAHVHWLTRPESAYYAWSDQIVAGIARASLYYPRGVSAILWLDE
ncbi:glycoside hydrolase family 52 protein [Ktedonospora formicarum]|uniref:Beta-xylosidase n=1 Tax=Ktedonospora formicarum TaxID=2778364 RepID=A0A8J3I8Z3_9CHLR|nr:glycoside hydrolase family 52 protein [Ktedonospora formicarum]GHO47973.1 hypothetical protein KSX_61360 [Ktedonospora formicarum]